MDCTGIQSQWDYQTPKIPACDLQQVYRTDFKWLLSHVRLSHWREPGRKVFLRSRIYICLYLGEKLGLRGYTRERVSRRKKTSSGRRRCCNKPRKKLMAGTSVVPGLWYSHLQFDLICDVVVRHFHPSPTASVPLLRVVTILLRVVTLAT